MAVSRHLLTSQTNQILEEIAKVGLDPRRFEWKDTERDVTIQHVPSGSYFNFAGDLDRCIYSPGLEKRTEMRNTPLGWYEQITHVRQWLASLRSEIEVPDLWAALRQEPELIEVSLSDTEDDRPFTPDERERIARNLREIRDYLLKNAMITEDRLRMIESRFIYMAEASTRLTRKDWKVMFLGTMAQIIGIAMLPSAVQGGLLRVAAEAFRWLGQHLL